MAVPSAIQSLGSYDKWIHFLCVGFPGFGKTVLGGTAPNALFLTTDPEGTISALAFGSKAKEWKIESWSEFSEAYTYLKNGGIQELNLGWIIIDNISEAQQLALQECMLNARKQNSRLDEFIPSLQDYLRSQNMVRTFVKRFHDLPVNVMWTSWAETHEDTEGNPFFSPAIHGQKGALAQAIAGYMNVVGYGEVVHDGKGEEVRRLHFTDTGMYKGKDRFNIIGAKIDRPTIPKLEKLVNEAVASMTSGKPAATQTAAARKPVARKTAPRAASTRKKA